MSNREFPKAPPRDVRPADRERAHELQIQLFTLEARLKAANFEDKEAYRRAIRERREELDALRTGE